jgi:hypothetical protein
MDETIVSIQKRTSRLTWLAALSGLLALATGSCESATSAGMGTVRLYVAGSSAGAPSAVSLNLDGPPTLAWTDPEVTVMSVALIPGEHEVANFEPDGESFDLVESGNGVGELLGSATVPVGVYEQLRLMMPSVSVLLDGETERTTVPVPSGMQTGIKIVFAEPLQVEVEGAVTIMLVFDLDHSFVVQGPPGAESVMFTPVIHATVTP